MMAALIVVVAPLAEARAQDGPPPVDVATPLQDTIIDWQEYTGRFQAVQRAELRARVSGTLQEVRFADGQLVEQGEVLFVIDQRPFAAARARLAASLDAARADLTLARAELRRGEQLVSRGALAESALDERRAASLSAAAQVTVAEAALREADLNLEFTEVLAPFSGRISDSIVDVGNLVLSGDTVLATVVSTDPIHLVFTASEADFLRFSRLAQAGDRPSSRTAANVVQARLIDETGWPHEGFMDFVQNELDPNAGTITGRAIFQNPDEFLTPGLFARLRLIASGEYEALLIPDEAVLADQSRKIVMVVDGEGAVEARVVEPGPIYRGLRVIRSGLSAQDQVVVAGVQRARPGGRVTPEPVEIGFPELAVTD